MESSIAASTASSIPQSQVDEYIKMVGEQAALDMGDAFAPGGRGAVGMGAAAAAAPAAAAKEPVAAGVPPPAAPKTDMPSAPTHAPGGAGGGSGGGGGGDSATDSLAARLAALRGSRS
jgi:hypothetical protein